MNNMIIMTSIFSIAILTACGGGGGTTETRPFPGGVNGIDPIAKLTLKKSRTATISDGRRVSFVSESGYNGKIEYVTENYANGTSKEVFKLATGTSSLTIKDVQRDQATNVSCSDGSTLKVKIYSDFSSGEVRTSGTYGGGDISCESDFDSILPRTVFDRDSLRVLLNDRTGWGTNYSTAGSSSCNHAIADMNGFSKDCTGEELVNYKITDTSGNVHKVTTKITFRGDIKN